MNLKDWEATIQQIAVESNHEPKEAGSKNLDRMACQAGKRTDLLAPVSD